MALASYVPVMLAADFAKNFMVNGGNQPEWQKGWGLWDCIENAIERSGIYGVSQFGFDVVKDIHRGNSGLFTLSWPTIEQLRDGVETMGGKKQFGAFAMKSMPANGLYSHLLGAAPTEDVKFGE